MIIGFTGRIAAGKGVLIDFLKEKNFDYYSHSQEVRKEAAKRGLEIKRSVLQDFGNEVRKNEGASAWTKRLVEEIKKNNSKNVIVDGIRNPAEIIELKKSFPDFILISVDAPQKTRFERVLSRGKDSDPKNWEEFLKIDERDLKEVDPLGQQVGVCMQMADFQINNDSTLEELEKKFERLLEVEKF